MRIGQSRRRCECGAITRDGVQRPVLVFLQHSQVEEQCGVGAAVLESIAIDRLRFAQMSELMQ